MNASRAASSSQARTTLGGLLEQAGVARLRIAGMMTQGCVAFTAASPDAAPYEVSVLPDRATTVDATLHGFALHALSTRVAIVQDA